MKWKITVFSWKVVTDLPSSRVHNLSYAGEQNASNNASNWLNNLSPILTQFLMFSQMVCFILLTVLLSKMLLIGDNLSGVNGIVGANYFTYLIPWIFVAFHSSLEVPPYL